MTLVEVEGKRYPVRSIEDLTLAHIARLQFELRSGQFEGITSLRTMDELRDMIGEYGTLSKAEQRHHPEALFLTCFTIWAAKVLAGESVTLMQAIDVPLSSIRFIRDPADRQDEGAPKARKPASVGGGQPAKRKKHH